MDKREDFAHIDGEPVSNPDDKRFSGDVGRSTSFENPSWGASTLETG